MTHRRVEYIVCDQCKIKNHRQCRGPLCDCKQAHHPVLTRRRKHAILQAAGDEDVIEKSESIKATSAGLPTLGKKR